MNLKMAALITLSVGLLASCGTSTTSASSNQAKSSAISSSSISSSSAMVYWNTAISYGTLVTGRIGEQSYRTVTIGAQTWMAENLNYSTASGSACYNSDCTDYGHSYDWATAMGFGTNCDTATCASSVTTPLQGICPSGWHIPSTSEWNTLQTTAGDTLAGKALKAQTSLWTVDTSTDQYGFSAIPAGLLYQDSAWYDQGAYAIFWSTTEDTTITQAKSWIIEDSFSVFVASPLSKKMGLSVRCLKD